MTLTTDNIPGPTGVSIDPDTWKEPVQVFPGIVRQSTYRWGSPEYFEKFVERLERDQHLSREHIEASLAALNPGGEKMIPQWNVVVERLDAKFLLPDGSQAPANRYGGIDLVKFSNRDNTFVPINPQYKKETFITASWKKVAGAIHPPEQLEGKMFTFNFWESKRFGGTMPARNVLVPTEVLPPTYVFTGEVSLIQVNREQTPGEAAVPTAGPVVVDQTAAVDRLVAEVLPGKSTTDAAGILMALPPELRLPELQSGLADGSLIQQLAAEGKITIGADNIIGLVV